MSLVIPLAVILRSENRQIVYKNQLIDDGNT